MALELFKVQVRENKPQLVWEHGQDWPPKIVAIPEDRIVEMVLPETTIKNPPTQTFAVSYLMDTTVMYVVETIPLFTIVGEPTMVE